MRSEGCLKGSQQLKKRRRLDSEYYGTIGALLIAFTLPFLGGFLIIIIVEYAPKPYSNF